MSKWFDNFGRTNIASLKNDTLVEQTEACLSFYGTIIKKMLNCKRSLTWHNTYHPLEVAISGVDNFATSLDFSKDIGLLDGHSTEFKTSKEKITGFFNQLYFNRKISLRLHQLKKTASLTKEKQRILDVTLLNYVESFYSKKQQLKTQITNFQLEKYEAEFLDNVRNAKKSFYIILADLSSIVSLPESMKNQARKNAIDLKFTDDEVYAFDLQDSTYINLMSHCVSRPIRKYIYQTYVALGSNQKNNNEDTLKKLIHWRNKKAKLNGHANYTDYAVSSSGLDSSKSISSFLDNMKQHFEPDLHEYQAIFKSFAKKNLKISRIFAWDGLFIKSEMNKFLTAKYNLDKIKIKYDLAQKSMFSLVKELFNINIVKADDTEFEKWHPDVDCYKVFNSQGQILTHLVFDILKRDEKVSKMVYQYTLSPNLQINKKNQPSHQAVVMHLEKNENEPLTMTLAETVDLFHEFGHALHLTLTQTPHHQQHPFAVEYDAIEFPSQWFERFAKKPNILGKIAFQNGKAIGIKKAKYLVQREEMHNAPWYWKHILHSKIDIHLNSKFKPNGHKTFHDALAPIFSKYEQKLTKYNKFQNNQFEYFYLGSTYYGYLWAEHMIEVWQETHGKKSLAEQGQLLIKLLNNAAQNTFTEEFTKIVVNAHESYLKFKPTSALAKEFL